MTYSLTATVQNLLRSFATMNNNFYPSSIVPKFYVPDNKLQWSTEFPEYYPPFYESPILHGKPWADVDIDKGKFIWNSMDGKVDRRSFKNYEIVNGYPLNPMGRTGIRGRGLLGRWGPNHAADSLVTRWKRNKNGDIIKHSSTELPVLQQIVIKRRDNGMWALPGGMVDPNEPDIAAAIREFFEEATNSQKSTKEEKERIRKTLKDFFKTGREIYKGYVNDSRNTDNAWIETTVFSFHDETGDIVNQVNLVAGDDAIGARWADCNSNVMLHASHSEFVKIILIEKNSHC